MTMSRQIRKHQYHRTQYPNFHYLSKQYSKSSKTTKLHPTLSETRKRDVLQ